MGNYHYPEVGVEFVDPTCFGRNYFKSAEVVDADREQVLADAAALKKLSVDYHHPEVGVESVDPTCFGRNYFKSAEVVDADHEQVLADVAALKELATDYHHPEVGVESVDSTCFGRNYFNSLDVDESNDDNESKAVLAEVSALKKIAVDYHHPEVDVEFVDPACFGRNYFKSAQVDADREQVLADAAAFQKLATDYYHPEVGVESVDPTCFGRNYFNSLDSVESIDDNEQKTIFAEAFALKKLAADYHHPEVGVESVDSTCFGRNYLNNLDVDESIDHNERKAVLAEASALKKLAGDYHCPEVGVKFVDPTCFGRNYFKSAEVVDVDREQVLADAAALKELASDYQHPEADVLSIDPSCYGRNYFNRLSLATDNQVSCSATSVHDDNVVHEHFDFDEDMEVDLYCDLKDAFSEVNLKNSSSRSDLSSPLSKNEGNLSRSPSSVMLFDNEMFSQEGVY